MHFQMQKDEQTHSFLMQGQTRWQKESLPEWDAGCSGESARSTSQQSRLRRIHGNPAARAASAPGMGSTRWVDQGLGHHLGVLVFNMWLPRGGTRKLCQIKFYYKGQQTTATVKSTHHLLL